MKADWDNVEQWFERAFDLPERERTDWLERECADVAVRLEVEELLRAGASADGALEPSAGYRRSLGGGFAPADDPSGRLVGRYRLDSLIGRGGMGTVWLAHRDDQTFDQRVAVKLVKRGLDTEQTLRRFRHERQVLAGLEHPGIARLIDGGATDDGLPYMVLEYVEGTPVDRWCEERSLELRARLRLFRSICSAVQFAHQNLVVHRDLKPTNILVGSDGAPKLLDFGIAKMLDPQVPGVTGDYSVRGTLLTPEYASPEQVQGLPVTTSTDVYSLGVVLYQLLTGALPYAFASRTLAEVERVVCNEPPARPSSHGAHGRALRGDLDTIVLKALHKSPERRYASVEQLSEDLRRYLQGLPVEARPDSLGYRLGKFVRRRRLVVAALTTVFLTMAGSLQVISGLLEEARAAESAAERRFHQLHSLANEVIFDLHDSIERVPGATLARHQLIETGLRYLDGLAQEAGEDPELLRDLAQGYARLAEVQGRPTAASLGETRAAYQSYERALAVLARLKQARPTDERLQLEHARIVDRAGTLELRLGRSAEALATFEASSEVLRVLGNAGDLATGLYHQVEALAQLGRTDEALAIGNECLALARRAVEQASDDRHARRTLQVALFKLADLRSATRDMSRAEAEAVEAVELAEALHAEAPGNLQLERDLALSLAMLARIRMGDGRAQQAEHAVARQLGIFERLQAADAANLHALRDLALARERVGSLHAAQGRWREALASFERCVALNSKVVEADPQVAEWRRSLALSYEMAIGAQLELGLLVAASESSARMIELLEPLVAADGADASSSRLLAMGYFRLAQLELERGEHAAALVQFDASAEQFAALSAADASDAWTRRMAMVAVYFVGWVHHERGHDDALDSEARRTHLLAACTEFERSLELTGELERLGMLQAGDREEAQAVREKIHACKLLLEQLR